MAKQVGLIKITGTIDGITFYEMNGQYYCKKTPIISKQRFKTHPAYTNCRRNASLFGQSSKLASKIYRSYTLTERVYGAFQRLTSEVYKRLKEGENEQQIQKDLSQFRFPLQTNNLQNKRRNKQRGKINVYAGNQNELIQFGKSLPLNNVLLDAINKLGIAI